MKLSETDKRFRDAASGVAEDSSEENGRWLAAELKETLDRVVLALGGDPDTDDPVAVAKARMQEIAVYERETERQLQAGLDTLTKR